MPTVPLSQHGLYLAPTSQPTKHGVTRIYLPGDPNFVEPPDDPKMLDLAHSSLGIRHEKLNEQQAELNRQFFDMEPGPARDKIAAKRGAIQDEMTEIARSHRESEVQAAGPAVSTPRSMAIKSAIADLEQKLAQGANPARVLALTREIKELEAELESAVREAGAERQAVAMANDLPTVAELHDEYLALQEQLRLAAPADKQRISEAFVKVYNAWLEAKKSQPVEASHSRHRADEDESASLVRYVNKFGSGFEATCDRMARNR